ncbi:restriction endonuclease subunit S [Falsochrobactrum ovis]|uniref:Type I restriction enzyme S subunit n=1 Tax=Falsochrobactrum ovis TaxID=1293442 RepID=A0A364JRU2_9HYPH|nr:restriction endonuclease subunit S [Falsochrobactrum ovis]RAK25533.1 type I restriction enzyme S subunit [Falsochrobactrum ovis]
MSEWQAYRIADLGQVITGRTPATNRPELLGNGTAFVTPTDISEQSIYAEPQRRLSSTGDAEFRRVILPPDSVCFTCIASIGKMCLTSEPTLTNQQINSLIVDHSRVVPRWAFYALKAMREEISAIASGAATPIINKTSFGNIQLLVPPLETQRRIASILGAYDDLIEVNRRRIAVLEEMARGLFEEWFVRFRFPGHESVSIHDTQDGPLPEGWGFAPLDSFVVLQRGFDLPKSSRVDGDIPVYSASGFHGGHNEHKVNGPGLVTGRSGTIGQVHLVMENFWPLNTTLYVREFRRAGPAYGLFLLRHMDLAKHSSGSAVPTLNRNHIHNIKLPAAPQSLIDRFERFALANLQGSRIIELQNERLVSSRDLLLPRLISGELSVAEAERELEEAA